MEQLCLKWTNYHSSVSSVFQSLRETEQFTDVTISTSEGNSIKAHRVVLCAASTYFRDILEGTTTWQHPVLILKDLPYTDLVSILEFIYTGSVSILPESLQSLLQTAKFLSISGLSSTNMEGESWSPTITPQSSLTSHSINKRKVCGSEIPKKVQKKEVNGNEESEEELPVKMEPLDIGPEEMSSSYSRVKHYEEAIGISDQLERPTSPTEHIFEREVTDNIYEDNRDNPTVPGDRDSSADSGPLTCLVCRATLSNCNALYYHMNYVHSGVVEPVDIIRNIGAVGLASGGEGVKSEGRE